MIRRTFAEDIERAAGDEATGPPKIATGAGVGGPLLPPALAPVVSSPGPRDRGSR